MFKTVWFEVIDSDMQVPERLCYTEVMRLNPMAKSHQHQSDGQGDPSSLKEFFQNRDDENHRTQKKSNHENREILDSLSVWHALLPAIFQHPKDRKSKGEKNVDTVHYNQM